MLFNSSEFLVFLPVVLLVYHLASGRLRRGFLLFASYVFYAAWDPRFLALLAFSTLLDFSLARAIPGASASRRRWLVRTSVLANLGVLGVFKYFDFFSASFRQLLAATGMGVLDSPTLDLILPLGISFYTFQTMAYTIDVGRGRVEPCRELLDYAVFVAYFPQLVAGPIERASHLLPQLRDPRAVDTEMLRGGLTLILLGFFKKVVIGDALVGPYVESAFGDPTTAPPVFLVLGALLFSIQIYVDFSGYTDIARGVSRLLGVELMINFEQPYLSRNVTEFWRRWHISLSTWLRDYLYIPLGGNRGGAARTYRNLMLTMLLGGLWHGASFNFVIWGGLHGAALAFHRALGWRVRPEDEAPIRGAAAWLRALPAIALTNVVVVFAWVFFRAQDLPTALLYLERMGMAFASPGALWLTTLTLGLYAGIVALLDLPPYRAGRHEFSESWPFVARVALYTVLGLAIWIAWPTEYAPFIYFQF